MSYELIKNTDLSSRIVDLYQAVERLHILYRIKQEAYSNESSEAVVNIICQM